MRAGKILRPQRTDRYLFDPLAKRVQRPLERRDLGLMLGVEHPPGFFSFRPRRRASSVFDTFCSRIETYSAALIDVPSSRQARCASRFLVLCSGMSARQSRHAHRHVYLRSAQCRDRTAAVPGALRMQIRASCSAKLSPVSVDGRLAAWVATHCAGQCHWIDQEMSKSSSEVVDGTAASRYSRRYVQSVISIILPSCMGLVPVRLRCSTRSRRARDETCACSDSITLLACSSRSQGTLRAILPAASRLTDQLEPGRLPEELRRDRPCIGTRYCASAADQCGQGEAMKRGELK